VIKVYTASKMSSEKNVAESTAPASPSRTSEEERPKRPWHQSFYTMLKQPGSALQIVLAALLAIAIGLAVTATVDDIPEAAPIILEIPGTLWLRALRATVLPLIITAIILAVQNLKAMASGGAKLARWTIIYYVGTTCLAIVHSIIMVDLVWRRLMIVADETSLAVDPEDQETIEERADNKAHDIIVQVFESFIPSNVVGAVANDELLAVLVTAVVVGYLLKGPDSPLLRAIREVDRIITIVITFLIYLAPIGVFFLILGNLMTLDMASVGVNLGVLIGASIAGMGIHLFIVLPIIFFAITRQNPYGYWMKNSPAWITAWGSASSAATLPVTLRCLRARQIPEVIARFSAPLGALINMDG